MHSIVNSSKHDSISISNIKSHQDLIGIKRDLDYEYDFQHPYSNDNNPNYNQINYGGIFNGEKIDPKVYNSDLLINSMMDEQNNKSINKDQSNMQELQSPFGNKQFDIISPKILQDQMCNTYFQSQQFDESNRIQNKQTVKVLDSQYDFNIRSIDQLNQIDLKHKMSFEEDAQDQQNQKTQLSHISNQFNAKLQNRGSAIYQNQDSVQSPLRSENSKKINGNGVNHQNNDLADEKNIHNLHLQMMKRNPSFLIDPNSMIGSQKLLNKNHPSNLNFGQASEHQNYQKSEFKKNSIATLHTKHKPKQNNIYVLSIFCLRSYFENGLIISKKSMIVRNYLKGKFIYDFLGLIIFIMSYTFEDLLFMSYLMIYRFISVRKIFSDMENKFQLREKGLAYSTFIQLILSILLVSHYSASIFHYIAQLQYKNGVEQTWLILQTQYDSPWIERYIISLYWSVITIITIGYGDITPRTIIERGYVIIFAFVGCGLFAYCINVIGEQVREIGREKSIFKRKSAKLNKFMHMRSLNKDLQQKVQKYYEYLFQEEMNEEEEGSNVFNNLTSLLKKQVWTDVYGKLLQQNKIFSTNFTTEFINMLSLKVKEKKFGPEEYIFVNGDTANNIFIIISGEVDQYLQRETLGDQYESSPKLHLINSYKKGEMFGQFEFFSQTKRKSTLKTKCVTSVAYLNYNDFLETIDKFEEDREVYYQIKDLINIYKNYSNIDLKCPICSEYRHRMHECNSINFILYREKLVKLAQQSDVQVRQDKSIVAREKMEQSKKKKNQQSQSIYIIETQKEIPLRRGVQKKITQDKYNAYVNNYNVKTQGFKIIVDILAEQIKETLSKEDEETLFQDRFDSSEIKEVESQVDEQEKQQEDISVSEEESSDQNPQFQKSHFNNYNNNQFQFSARRKGSSFSSKQIHVEVSPEQEESQQMAGSIKRDGRKCKTIVSNAKSSYKSLQQQDSDRRIQICRSQQKIDYTYVLQSEVNPFQISQAYVADEIFNFPEDIIETVCGKNQRSVYFQGSPTRYQNPISATSQYNKQQSKNSEVNSQVSSSNSSISPTIFQPLSLRHIDSKNQFPNINSSNYTNSNSFNNPSPFPLSPSGSQYKNFSQNINNQSNLISINPIRTNTAYTLSPSNSGGQTNSNSFGTAIMNLSNQPYSSQQDYNQMITNNPFAAQYNQPNSPYSNRLGTYGIYLPALQQLEPINELHSKEILTSSSEENNDQDITPARRSEKGSKIMVNQPVQNLRRQSKEPSIKLHVKHKEQQSGNTNSQYIGSNGTIGYHHMEAISPQRIQQHLSQESIQRGLSSEQDSGTLEDKIQTNTQYNQKQKIPSTQHVQFAENEDEILQNYSGGTLNNQNTLQSFEQTQQNIKSSQKSKNSNRSNPKPSKFSNNQYVYNSFVSQMSQQNVQKMNTSNYNDLQKNILFTRSYSQQNGNQMNVPPNNNAYTIFNQFQNSNNINQGSGTVINTLNGNNNNMVNNNTVANFQQQMLGANNGLSSQISWQYDPSSLYSKLMSRQSVQLKFKKDQDFCALIYKKKINLKGIDDVYEEIYNNFDAMRIYKFYFKYNNFAFIPSKDKQKSINKRYHASIATSKPRKESRENNLRRNTNRTSLQFHLSRGNTNILQQQSTLRTSNRLSSASLSQNPKIFLDNKFAKNKIVKI